MIIDARKKIVNPVHRQVDHEYILRRLGIEIGEVRDSGWAPISSPFREDKKPSAAINLDSGFFKDSGTGEKLKFWDFVAKIEGHGTQEDARERWGDNYDPIPKKKKKGAKREFAKYVDMFRGSVADPWINHLSCEWMVHRSVLDRLKIGSVKDIWTIPERDAAGKIIGIATRSHDHARKKCYTGSERGLTFDPDSSYDGSFVICTEGASCTTSAMQMGVAAVGRPGADGKLNLMVEFIQTRVSMDTRFLVLADNDGGQEASKKYAQELAKKTGRQIDWAYIYETGIKDLRDWRKKYEGNWQDFERCLVVSTFFPSDNISQDDGLSFLDQSSWEEIGEFPGETVFLPDMQKKVETGEPESHSDSCSCDSCTVKARTVEAREREKGGYNCDHTAFYTNGDKAFFGRLDCRGWKCDKCRVKHQIPKWTKHLTSLLARYKTFYVGTVDPKDNKKLTRQVRDGGGGFFHIMSEEFGDLIVATAPFRGSKEVSNEKAKEQLDFFLLNLKVMPPLSRIKSSRGQVITTSKGPKNAKNHPNNWQLKEYREDSGYKRIDFPRASDVTVKKVAKEFNCKFKTLQLNPAVKVMFAEIIPSPNYYGNITKLLEAMAERINDIVNPELEDSLHSSKEENKVIEPDNGFTPKNEFEEGWGSLDSYPQDPLWSNSPPG